MTDIETEIKWEDPPADPRGRKQNREISDKLRESPGRWALISEDASAGMTTRIKKGVGCWSPPGAFEARGVAGDRGGRYKVWARYVGEVSA